MGPLTVAHPNEAERQLARAIANVIHCRGSEIETGKDYVLTVVVRKRNGDGATELRSMSLAKVEEVRGPSDHAKRAWEMYCEATAGCMSAADFWTDLPPQIQLEYLARARAEAGQ